MAERQEALLTTTSSTSDEFSTASCSLISPRRIYAASDCHLQLYERDCKYTKYTSNNETATSAVKQYTTSASGHYKDACSPSEKMRKPHAKRPTPEWAREKRRKFAMEHYPIEENYMLPNVAGEFDKLSQEYSNANEVSLIDSDSAKSPSSPSYQPIEPAYCALQEAEPVFDENENVLININCGGTEHGECQKNAHMNDEERIKALRSDSEASFVMLNSAKSGSNESERYDIDEAVVARLKKVAADFKDRQKNVPKMFSTMKKTVNEREEYEKQMLLEIEEAERNLRERIELAAKKAADELVEFEKHSNTVLRLQSDVNEVVKQLPAHEKTTSTLLENHRMCEAMKRKEINEKRLRVANGVGNTTALEEMLPFYAEFATSITVLDNSLSRLRREFLSHSPELDRLVGRIALELDFVRAEIMKHNSSAMTLDDVLSLRARHDTVAKTFVNAAKSTERTKAVWSKPMAKEAKHQISNTAASTFSSESDHSEYLSAHSSPICTLADSSDIIEHDNQIDYERNVTKIASPQFCPSAESYSNSGALDDSTSWPVAIVTNTVRPVNYEVNVGYDRIVTKCAADGARSTKYCESLPLSSDSDASFASTSGTGATSTMADEITCIDQDSAGAATFFPSVNLITAIDSISSPHFADGNAFDLECEPTQLSYSNTSIAQ